MIASILEKKIDIKELDKAIDKYSKSHFTVRYLIMNDATQYDLGCLAGHELLFNSDIHKNLITNTIIQYKGINVAICNQLNYGEVEIL